MQRCVDLVTRLLNCRFDPGDTDLLFSDVKAMNKSGFLALSYQHQSPLGTSVTSYSRKLRHESFHRACTEATLRAVKEVRVVEGDSEAMEVGLVAKLMSSGIKIIHLQ